jgi:hypothetical protein
MHVLIGSAIIGAHSPAEAPGPIQRAVCPLLRHRRPPRKAWLGSESSGHGVFFSDLALSDIGHLDPVKEEEEKDAPACTIARAVEGRVLGVEGGTTDGRGPDSGSGTRLIATELSGENWREARRGG